MKLEYGNYQLESVPPRNAGGLGGQYMFIDTQRDKELTLSLAQLNAIHILVAMIEPCGDDSCPCFMRGYNDERAR